MKKLMAIALLFVNMQSAEASLLGTLENPISLCASDTVSPKIDQFMGTYVTIAFLGVDGEKSRERIRLQPGGGWYGNNDEFQAFRSERPLDLSAFLVPGLNWLSIRSDAAQGQSSSALIIRLRHNEQERVLRTLYAVEFASVGTPSSASFTVVRTDVFFHLANCQEKP